MTPKFLFTFSCLLACRLANGGGPSRRDPHPAPCYRLKYDPGHIEGGHSSRCFHMRPMSFEGCKILLGAYNECSALSYQEGQCSLHSDLSSTYTHAKSPPRGEKLALVYTKDLASAAGICSSETAFTTTALSSFKACLNRGHSSDANRRSTAQLPLLAIVMSVSDDWPDTRRAGFAAVVSNFDCYCRTHGYSFVVNRIKSESPYQFYHERHAEILRKYVNHYQYVMHIDADSLVLNMNRSMSEFLSAGHQYDVHLHVHESGEVTASNYIVKNSHYGKCFLQYWGDIRPPAPYPESPAHSLNKLTYSTLNFDNGDLMAALMNLISPRRFLQCMAAVGRMSEARMISFHNPYLQVHIECWKRMLVPKSYNTSGFVKDPGRPIATERALRIYLPREGFWRTFARKGRFGTWWDQLFGSCFITSDVIGHGWKAMPRVLWGNSTCPNDDHSAGSLQVRVDSPGYNNKCDWLSPEDELRIARIYCLWKSPICVLGSESGDNRCIGGGLPCTRTGSPHLTVEETESQLGFEGVRWNAFEKFGVGNEAWWRQQLCSWCP